MNPRTRLVLVALLAAANALILVAAPTAAQPAPPRPVDLPCATNVGAQILGTGTPSGID